MIGCPSCGAPMSEPAPENCQEKYRHAHETVTLGDWMPLSGEIVWDVAWGPNAEDADAKRRPGTKDNEMIPGVPRPQAEILTYNEDEDKLLIRWLPGGPEVERPLDEVEPVPEKYRRHKAVPQPVTFMEEAPAAGEFEPKFIFVMRAVGPEGACQVKLGPMTQPIGDHDADDEQKEQLLRFYRGAFDADPSQVGTALLPYMPQEDGEEGLH